MTTSHELHTTAVWKSTEPGEGSIISDTLDIPRLSTLLHQDADTASPEDLLLAAAASCYLITLRTLLEHRQVPIRHIEVHSQAHIENESGLRFDSIVHYPTIVVEGPCDEDVLRSYAAHAELTCMVSSALRGNVDIRVVPSVQVLAQA